MKRLRSLPHTITSRFLARLAEPDETHAVIVEVMSAPFGSGPLTVPGSTQHTYQYNLSRESSNHRLIIPLSVWQAEKKKLAIDIFEMPQPGVILLPDVAKWEDVYQEATGQTYRKPGQEEDPEAEEPEAPETLSDQILNESRVTDPEDPEDPEEPETTKEEEREQLIAEAESLGIAIDKRWGNERISNAIKEHPPGDE